MRLTISSPQTAEIGEDRQKKDVTTGQCNHNSCDVIQSVRDGACAQVPVFNTDK